MGLSDCTQNQVGHSLPVSASCHGHINTTEAIQMLFINIITQFIGCTRADIQQPNSTRKNSLLDRPNIMQRNKQVGDVAYVPDKSPSDTDEDFETESCLKPPSGIDNHLPIPTSSEVEAGLAVGATVELKDGSFIRICELMIPKTPRAARLSGELFRRACDFPDWVPTAFGLNELIMIREAKKDEMTDNSKFMRTATMDEAKRIRQLIMINSPEMDVALQGEYQIFLDQIDGQSSVPAPLFYRWRFVAELSRSSTATSRRTAQSLETAKELTKALLLYSNTGIRHHEQSSSKKKRGLTDANPRPSKRSHISSISAGSIPHNKKTYAFADAFCGAGGMSRAAHEASFQIIWAFDQDSLATTAYQSNFPGATTHTIEASELVSEQSKYYAPTVDVLHISPPCQAFATAQRTPGPNNEANAACLHMVAPLIEKVNPRIVTLEEVPGLRSDHPADFAQLVKSITSLNYSITWTIMKCVEHGLPQRRKRLFMLASR